MQKALRLQPAVQLAKFGVQPSFTEGSKKVRHLPRYLSMREGPIVLFRISSLGPYGPASVPQEAPIIWDSAEMVGSVQAITFGKFKLGWQ